MEGWLSIPPNYSSSAGCPHRAPDIGGSGEAGKTFTLIWPQQIPTGFGDSVASIATVVASAGSVESPG